jgi:hypothetical protein
VAAVTVIADSDGDGISDAWETAHGLNPTNAADRTLDSDNDGLGNYQEYLAGTDPTNSQHTLRVELLGTNADGLTLRFAAGTNRTFALYSTPGLNPAQWQLLSNFCAEPSNHVESLLMQLSNQTNRYYRIVTPVSH